MGYGWVLPGSLLRSPNARRPDGQGTELEGWDQVHGYPSLAVMASVLHGLAGMGSSAAGRQFACCHAPCFAKRARVAANGDGSPDAGEDLYRTATVGANTHIDSKHALETSRPGHQAALLRGVGGSPFALTSIGGAWVAGRAPRLGADRSRQLTKKPRIAAGLLLLDPSEATATATGCRASCIESQDLEVHTAHAAAVTVVTAARSVLLRQLGDHGFGGDQQAGVGAKRLVAAKRPNEAASCSAVSDLGRVQDAHRDHVTNRANRAAMKRRRSPRSGRCRAAGPPWRAWRSRCRGSALR
jgi:hypothetical protein